MTGTASFDNTHTLCRQASKAIGATKLSEIGEDWRNFEVIGIDEGQFFDDVSLSSSHFSDRNFRGERGEPGQGGDSGGVGRDVCADDV